MSIPTRLSIGAAAWTDLGSGPFELRLLSSGVLRVAQSATEPVTATAGDALIGLIPGSDSIVIRASIKVWVRSDAGTLDVDKYEASSNSVSISGSIPSGANTIGAVSINGSIPSGANTIGAVTNDRLTDALIGDYETVAASQTDQVLGATGATGDFLSGVLIVPATTAAGAVSIKDGSGSAITVFAGGATTPLAALVPFFVPLGIKSSSGAWRVTTGANVSVVGVGNFT